jgi:hypothetical protein
MARSKYTQMQDNSVALYGQMMDFATRVAHPEKLRKKWFSVHDREDHWEINGQEVPFSEPFVLPDGTKLMFPGDPSGPPKHTKHCGCSFVLDGDSIIEAMAP